MEVIQYVTIASVVIAFLAIIIKVIKYATAPESMRWELYPVPHEKGRSEYGGSYFEELDWWTKPRHSDMFNEMKEMASEIIFLKGVLHNNKKVWRFSFPFHFGLYLCIGWLFLLLLGGILDAVGVGVSADAGVFGLIIHYLTVISGYAGLILTGIGAFGLFVWRATDPNQRSYNSFAEYFNLLFIGAVVVMALITHLSSDPGFAYLRGYIAAILSFEPAVIPGTLFGIEVVLMSLLIMYIPLSRMSHFVAKYFLYHAVRWHDEPNVRGSKIEKRLTELLGKKISWSAEHMHPGKTWGEAVQEKENEQ